MRDVNDDRVDIAALSRELIFEQVTGPLGLSAGKAEDRYVVRADRVGDDRGEDCNANPGRHDGAAVGHTPAGESAQRLVGLGAQLAITRTGGHHHLEGVHGGMHGAPLLARHIRRTRW